MLPLWLAVCHPRKKHKATLWLTGGLASLYHLIQCPQSVNKEVVLMMLVDSMKKLVPAIELTTLFKVRATAGLRLQSRHKA